MDKINGNFTAPLRSGAIRSASAWPRFRPSIAASIGDHGTSNTMKIRDNGRCKADVPSGGHGTRSKWRRVKRFGLRRWIALWKGQEYRPHQLHGQQRAAEKDEEELRMPDGQLGAIHDVAIVEL
ncbi:MAG: hypothetical protein WBP94_07140 [Rhodomicrobiaceae bacterium]